MFALDIGTRSVTGLILSESNGAFTLVDYYTKEHNERSMFDGQIHDVVSVAKVIQEVKDTLEKDHGELTDVSVAAAGRALKTVKASASLDLNQQPITEKETIKHLELSAVHLAQKQLMNHNEAVYFSHYYCVGYSILYYELDGERIGSLIDQRGEVATVEVIATFLPKIVVESLISALKRSGLHMKALTLEPIAAIHVLIPESMRRLNVALIDIGAGTSDIALTKDGTIVAYGMVPLAGDKITEAMSDAYILDFPEAEKAKRDIVSNGETMIEDILGFQTTVTLEDLLLHTNIHIETIATTLAHEVLELNGKAPQAIMLIGGGSLTPNLTKLLAEKIGLAEQRVAVRGVDGIQSIVLSKDTPIGPDYVTPFGIAIASKQNPVHYINLTVNNQSIRMFEMNELTVGDALIQAGIELKTLFGKPGLAYFITMNKMNITLRGELGSSPVIYVNGNEEYLETPIQQNDEITVYEGLDGTSPNIQLHELIGDYPATPVFYNKKRYSLEPQLLVNGKTVNNSYTVADKDVIDIKYITTIQQFIESIGKEHSSNEFVLTVNKKRLYMNKGRNQLSVNNVEVDPSYILQKNDHIRIQKADTVYVKDVLQQLNIEPTQSIQVTFGDTLIQLKKQIVEISIDENSLSIDDIIKNNSSITVKIKQQTPFIFQDVFRYVDIDLSTKSGSFSLRKNNIETTFFEHLTEGDHLQIVWGK